VTSRKSQKSLENKNDKRMRFLVFVSAVAALVLVAPRMVSSFGVVVCPYSSIRSRRHTCYVPSYMNSRDSSSSSSSSSPSWTTTSSSNKNNESPQAHDGEALQALFSEQCDQDGLMTKDTLQSVPMIAELLVRNIYTHVCSDYTLSS
jgi:hypothetical protein